MNREMNPLSREEIDALINLNRAVEMESVTKTPSTPLQDHLSSVFLVSVFIGGATSMRLLYGGNDGEIMQSCQQSYQHIFQLLKMGSLNMDTLNVRELTEAGLYLTPVASFFLMAYSLLVLELMGTKNISSINLDQPPHEPPRA